MNHGTDEFTIYKSTRVGICRDDKIGFYHLQ